MSAVEALDTMDARIPWQDPETGHGEPLCGVWRVVRKHRNIIMRGFRIRTCSQGGWPPGRALRGPRSPAPWQDPPSPLPQLHDEAGYLGGLHRGRPGALHRPCTTMTDGRWVGSIIKR